MPPKNAAASLAPGAMRSPGATPLKADEARNASPAAAARAKAAKDAPNTDATKLGVVAVDKELMHAMDALFDKSNEIVVAAFEVLRLKEAQETTGTQLLQALGAKSYLAGRQAPAPRVLCFTVRRSRAAENSRGFKPYLNLVKPVDADTYEVRHAFPLKQVEELRVQPGGLEYGGVHLQVLDVVVAGADKGSSRSKDVGRKDASSRAGGGAKGLPSFGLHDGDALSAFLAVTLQLSKQVQRPPPRFVGAEQAAITQWWAAHGPGLVGQLGELADEVLQGSATDQDGPDESQRVLVSAKEEKDLEDLLDIYAMGVGDVTEFESRLSDEFDALQAANIQSLLADSGAAEVVLLPLRRTAQMLEDLEETLQVFDTKLRHMRQDISAIESYNNTLQRTERNNARLLETLQGLLSDIKVTTDMRSSLQDPPFEAEKLSVVMKPGWALVKKLSRLTPGNADCISPHLMQMTVVVEAQQEMRQLAKTFVAKAVAYLTSRIYKVVEDISAELAAKASADKAARIQPCDHTKLRGLRERHAELVQLIHALDKGALDALRDTYLKSINLLLRKEVRSAASELRKAAALDAQYTPLDFNLTKETSTSRAAAQVVGGNDAASLASGERESVSPPLGRPGPSSTLSRSTQGTLASLHMVMKARGGPPEGSVSMPINEAWSHLLELWLPLLLEELQAATQFLLLNKPPAAEDKRDAAKATPRPVLFEGQVQAEATPLPAESLVLLEQLLAGLEPEFLVLVDACSKSSQQILAHPMCASTTWWLQQVMVAPEAPPLVHLLSHCHLRLRDRVKGYQKAQLAAMTAYISKANQGVKALHVLAFITQFALLMHHMEQLLASQQDVAALCEAQQQEQPSGGGKDEDDRGSTRSTPREGGARFTPRAPVYQKLVGTIFNTLERMAVVDAKYGQRLRIENYAFFAESIRPLLSESRSMALAPYLTQAQDRMEEASRLYVEQQLQHAPLWRLLDYSAKLTRLLEMVAPHEVPFQEGCSAAEVRSLLHASLKEPSKQLAGIAARIRKHLGASSLALRVWERTQQELATRYRCLCQQIEQCYPSGQVQVTLLPAQLKELMGQVSLVA